jgi:thioredoxin-related protein
MRSTVFLLSIFLLFIAYPLFCQNTQPDSAQAILKAAVTEAKSSNKNVFLIFHATWCNWCKRLETALEAPEIKKLIDDNYIVVKLDVLEREEKIQINENPGASKVLAEFGWDDKSGIPFMVFLDRKGKMIANSNVMPKKQNIGYPGSKEEITAFVKLLKKTAPHMTGRQRAVISDYLKKNAPK